MILFNIMSWKEFFGWNKTSVSLSALLIIISLYLFTALEFVETFPEQCGLTYPIHLHINCSLAHFLPWISMIILPLTIIYLIISLIMKFKNK